MFDLAPLAIALHAPAFARARDRTEANAALARQALDLWNIPPARYVDLGYGADIGLDTWIAASQDGSAALFAPDHLLHVAGQPDSHTSTAYADLIADYRAAFPDLRVTVDSVAAQNNLVAARLTVRGTRVGTYRGQSPTGREVSMPGSVFFRIADGQIAETWFDVDALAVLAQPAATSAAAAAPPAASSASATEEPDLSSTTP